MSPVPYFSNAIQAIFKNWSGLQFAIQQGAGGSQNREKEAWLMTVTESWFYENPNLQAYEVADFLEQILLREFDLFIEDGSSEEIGSMLVEYFSHCSRLGESEILEKLRALPRCDLSLCKCEDEEDEALNRNINTIENTVEQMEESLSKIFI